MRSLRGFTLKLILNPHTSASEKTKAYPVNGNSMKIGSSFVCHVVLKELQDVHCIITLNEHNQVEAQNLSIEHPIRINGAVVKYSCVLEEGDSLDVLGYRFLWDKTETPDSVQEAELLEASYQTDHPTDLERRKSEPRVVYHKWVPCVKSNQSINFGEGEVSSTTEDGGSEIEMNIENKENQQPTGSKVTESVDEDSEAEQEKTILHELNEHSTSALIDLSTPEPPQQSVNFIDLNTPAPVKGKTPVRKIPATESKWPKKILDPRFSISTIESDFDNIANKSSGQSTPMVNRLAGTSKSHAHLIEMSDINESNESSDQSTIISNSACKVAVDSTIDLEEVPETQPADESVIDELFEDAEELAKSDVDVCQPLPEDCEGDALENADEFIPATQTELPTLDGDEIFQQVAANLNAPQGDYKTDEREHQGAQMPHPSSPEEKQEEPEPELKTKSFTPRKSLRTPKKMDHQCCTPKSLSKVLVEESMQRRSPRTSRMNLSLRIDNSKAGTPMVPKSLSKSLMVSNLQKSAKKARSSKANKSVVEIADDSVAVDQTATEDNVIVLLADESIVPASPLVFENTIGGNDSDIICLASQEDTHSSLQDPSTKLCTEEGGRCEDSSNIEKEAAVIAEVTEESTVPQEMLTECADTAEPDIDSHDENISEMYKSPREAISMSKNSSSKGSLQKTPKSKSPAEAESPKVLRSPLKNVSNLVGIRELFKTPKSDMEKNLSGLREMMRTPQTVMHVVTDVVGLKELMKTPVAKSNDANLIGLKEMLKTPHNKGIENLLGIKELVNTPAPKADVNLVGLRELMNTPAPKRETNLVGLKELVNTPAPKADVNLVGLRELMNTPAPKRETNLVGLKELVNTPAPNTDVNLLGLKELVNTPAPKPLTNLMGVKELLNTPNTATVNTLGMKEMFKTPKATLGVNMVGVRELMKTPAVKKAPDDSGVGLREMMQTPRPGPTASLFETDTVGIAEIFKTPATIRIDTQSRKEQEQVKPAVIPEDEEIEVSALDTSSELFDKMMNRKSMTAKHTYSRKTPIKTEANVNLTPEKKVEIDRWVESIIVAGTGETKKIVNNTMQVLSDRYSNVTPSQVIKTESVMRDVEDIKTRVSVSVEEIAPTDTTGIAEAPELQRPDTETAVGVKEKPKRGRKPLVKTNSLDHASTVNTPKRTRRNLKNELDDTPRASPRTRRVASIQREESLAEPTDIQDSISKDKKEILEESTPSQEKGKADIVDKPEKRGRGGRTAKKVSEATEVSTPQRRGRRPKVVEELVEPKVAEPAATITPRGRKKVKTAIEDAKQIDVQKVEGPTNRRGRAAVKQVMEIEKPPAEEKKIMAEGAPEELRTMKTIESVPKPTGRGRGRKAAAKTVTSESEQTATEADEPKAKQNATRGSRRKKAIEEHSTEPESELSVLDGKKEVSLEIPKASGRGRRGAYAKKKEDVDNQNDVETGGLSPVKKPKLANEEKDDSIMIMKPTRGRKAVLQQATALVNESVTSTPRKGLRVERKAAAVDPEPVPESPKTKRGKKTAIQADDQAEFPKTAKIQEDADEGHSKAVEEEKPKRRGRAKKEVGQADVTDSSLAEHNTTSTNNKTVRTRREKMAEKRTEDSVESEKETTADESVDKTSSTRAKRVATKRTPAASSDKTEPEEPARKTRATRRNN